jgi:hypothetical protein
MFSPETQAKSFEMLSSPLSIAIWIRRINLIDLCPSKRLAQHCQRFRRVEWLAADDAFYSQCCL